MYFCVVIRSFFFDAGGKNPVNNGSRSEHWTVGQIGQLLSTCASRFDYSDFNILYKHKRVY